MARSDSKRMKAFGKRLDEMRKTPSAAVTKTEEDLASKATKGATVPDMKSTKPGAGLSFKSAFAAARSAGDKTFTWNGKSYNTRVKGEDAPKITRTAPKTEGKVAPKIENKVAPKPEVKAVPRPEIKAPVSLALASRGKDVPAPRRNIDRFNLDKVREMSARMDSKKGTTFGGAFKAKGGKVKTFKTGGPVMESKRKPIDMRRAILGSDKDIVDRANRTPAEKMPKEGPKEMPYRRPKLKKAGEMGYKSGGSVMKKGADGIAKKGKTKGMMPKMNKGGKCYAKGGSIDGIAKKGKTKGKMC